MTVRSISAGGDAPASGPAPIGRLSLLDGQGMRYFFTAYPVRAVPTGERAAYAFARLEGTEPVPLFVDSAEALAPRLADHERMEEAVALGAVYLLVHMPDPEDPLPHTEAARRLAAHHRPPLNRLRAPAPRRVDTGRQQVAGLEPDGGGSGA